MPGMENDHHDVDNERPKYERRSKLLFWHKMVNFNDTNPIKEKTYRKFQKNCFLRARKPCKKLHDVSDCSPEDSLSIPCDESQKNPTGQQSLTGEPKQHSGAKDQPSNRVEESSAWPSTAEHVAATLPDGAKCLSVSCDKIKLEEGHEKIAKTEASNEKMMLKSSLQYIPHEICSSTDDQICKAEHVSSSDNTDNTSDFRHYFPCKEVELESSGDNSADVRQTRCLQDNSDLQTLHNDHELKDQHEANKNYSVTIFAYRCQICQTGFATLHMLQEHNYEQCSEIVKSKQRLEETDANTQSQAFVFSLKCAICPETNTFENEQSYRQHVRNCHSKFPHVTSVKCALCGSKYIFDSISQLEVHLRQKHKFSRYDSNTKGSDGVGRTCRVGIKKKSTGMRVPRVNSNFYICRICDEPFSERLPFLTHYDNHRLQTRVSDFPMEKVQKIIEPAGDLKISSGSFISDSVHTEVKHEISESIQGIILANNCEGKLDPNTDLNAKISTTEQMNVEDTPDSENSKVSIVIEGFEIEVNHPVDDEHFPSNCHDHNRQQVCRSANTDEVVCKRCFRSFSNYFQLCLHDKDCIQPGENNEEHASQRKKKIYSCPICHKQYNRVLEYQNHISEHGELSMTDLGIQLSSNDSVLYELETCKEINNSDEKNFKRNAQNRKEKKCRICLTCSKTFLSLSGYHRHMKRHGYNNTGNKCVKPERQNSSTSKRRGVRKTRKKVSEDIGDMHCAPNVEHNCDTNITYETNVNSSENTTVGPLYEDSSLKGDDNPKYGDPAVDGDSSTQTEFVISNAFSLNDDNYGNVDILTRMECKLAMEQELEYSPKEDVHVQHGLSEDSVEVCDVDDSKPLIEDDEIVNVVGKYDSMTELVDKFEGERNGQVLTDTQDGIEVRQVANRNTVGLGGFSERNTKQEVNGTEALNLRCDICSKVLPNVAFRRIHMLLHKRHNLNMI